MKGLRPLLRQVAYQSGVLSLLRNRQRQTLTVVMFHRVIDRADPDFAQADPVYTVSVPLFQQLLGFFHDHYAVVDIRHVLDAAEGTRALPEHALLITFDDGWADNLRYAAPLLQARGMPAVIFVAAEAVQAASMTWWQEEVYAAGRHGSLMQWLVQNDDVARTMNAVPKDAADYTVQVVTHLALMDPDDRVNILGTLPRVACHTRMMLDIDELRRLADFGIDVGLHGYRHVPLTMLADVETELVAAREAMAAASAGTAITKALACPNGFYDANTVAAARAVGIKLVFTSDKVLNATTGGMLTTARPLGRIGLTTSQLQFESAPDQLDPSRAARWLWDRECW